MELISREIIAIPFQIRDEISAVLRLINKYRDVPMFFADACLVRLSEQADNSTLLTRDNDFRFYRKNRRKLIPLLMP